MAEHDSSPDRPPVYRVGPSGWSYDDWNGIVYPARAPARFDRLAHIARYFDAVEVNTSFYRPVSAGMSESWVRRVANRPGFRFTFKLHQSFTHDRGDYSRRAVETFLDGVRPVSDASRLGCLLLQFPWSFRRCAASLDRLRRLADDFGAYRPIVELRHDDWSHPETEAELRALRMGYCNIDQPLLAHCLAPTALATGPVGYVRFHGRRKDTWFAKGIEPFRRYDYLYATEELTEWLPRIRRVGAQCEEVYVFSNNHYRGQGPANALQLRAMLEGSNVDAPPELMRRFPELADVCRRQGHGFPETLF